MNNVLQTVEVVRGEYGSFFHPVLSAAIKEHLGNKEFYTRAELESFASSQNIELEQVSFELDAPDELQDKYSDGDPDITEWNPSPPNDKEGWFIVSLHDTEDGPVCWWARHLSCETNSAKQHFINDHSTDDQASDALTFEWDVQQNNFAQAMTRARWNTYQKAWQTRQAEVELLNVRITDVASSAHAYGYEQGHSDGQDGNKNCQWSWDQYKDQIFATPQGWAWYRADDIDQLTRELDVAINGKDGAAKQAMLCDLVAQVKQQGLKALSNAILENDCMIGQTWFMKGTPVAALIEFAEGVYKAEVAAQNSKIEFHTDGDGIWFAHDVPFFGRVQLDRMEEHGLVQWDIYFNECWQGPFDSKSQAIQHLEVCIQEMREEEAQAKEKSHD